MPTRNVQGKAKEVTLRRWRVIEAEAQGGTRTRHVWGHDVANNLGRASSEIVKFNLETMTATTRSGSNYKLVGLPGNSILGNHAWVNRCNIHCVVSEIDITDEYLNVNQVSKVGFAKITSAACQQEDL